jgi:hypothetical protein
MTRCRIGCAVAALLVAMMALPAGAATIVRVADEVMVDEAPLVVVARVVEKGPTASRTPATEYRFAVEQVLKGSVGPELTVRVPGGMGTDGIGLRIYGAPSFAPGERAILFLEGRPGGDHRILHLMQGAFREVRRDGRALALRDLADVTELRVRAGAIDAAPAADAEPARDFEAFARWIADSARGAAPAADYRVSLPAGSESPGRIAAPANFFFDLQTGLRLRWFEFDDGDSVPWHFGTGGQPAVPSNGLDQFKVALNAWNADSQTPIRYLFAGTSSASGGLCDPDFCNGFDGYDELNVILFGDPNGELSNLSPTCSGTLAYAGPWFTNATGVFRGEEFHRIVNADIVINNGLECFFNGIANPGKAAEQLFAHELGHTLGIDHPCGNTGGPDQNCTNPTFDDALMRAFFHMDARGAKLNSDDLAAARSLYRQGGGQQGNPPAAPTNLTATTFSTTEIDLAWQDNSNNETGFVVEAKTLGGSFVALATLPANTTGAEVFGLTPATGYVFRVRATNDQGTSAPTNEAQASTNAVPGPCFPGAQTLCLASDRFRVDVDWATGGPQATTGKGQVVPGVASDDSGLFYFFAEANWELVVKVLAACPVNQRFWVFAGGLTNVEVVLRVIDTQSGAVRHYFNPQGTAFQPVQDTAAFATCGSGTF